MQIEFSLRFIASDGCSRNRLLCLTRTRKMFLRTFPRIALLSVTSSKKRFPVGNLLYAPGSPVRVPPFRKAVSSPSSTTRCVVLCGRGPRRWPSLSDLPSLTETEPSPRQTTTITATEQRSCLRSSFPPRLNPLLQQRSRTLGGVAEEERRRCSGDAGGFIWKERNGKGMATSTSELFLDLGYGGCVAVECWEGHDVSRRYSCFDVVERNCRICKREGR